MDYVKIKQYFQYAQRKYQAEKDNGEISLLTYYKKNLVISRLMAQYTIDEYNKAYDKYNTLRRMKQRFKQQGVVITTLDAQIIVPVMICQSIKDFIATLGKSICVCLDGWQCFGATYEDLYNFCCCSEKTISEMKKDIADGTVLFSDLVFIHYPDYKENGNFIQICKYAPITHSVKAHMKNEMKTACKDRDIREKINNKLFELFPDLEDCCVIATEDEFGDTILTDLDGFPIDDNE